MRVTRTRAQEPNRTAECSRWARDGRMVSSGVTMPNAFRGKHVRKASLEQTFSSSYIFLWAVLQQ